MVFNHCQLWTIAGHSLSCNAKKIIYGKVSASSAFVKTGRLISNLLKLTWHLFALFIDDHLE